MKYSTLVARPGVYFCRPMLNTPCWIRSAIMNPTAMQMKKNPVVPRSASRVRLKKRPIWSKSRALSLEVGKSSLPV